jgi:hypothetical protein
MLIEKIPVPKCDVLDSVFDSYRIGEQISDCQE